MIFRGKIVGVLLGYLSGEWVGGLLGIVLGHIVDLWFSKKQRRRGSFSNDYERTQAAFYSATFQVMGYLAKADGRVSSAEISKAEEAIKRMELNAVQRKTAIDLFNQGKNKKFNLQKTVRDFYRKCRNQPALLQSFMEHQIETALVGQGLSPQQNNALLQISKIVGLRQSDLQNLIEKVRKSNISSSIASGAGIYTEEQACHILGVDKRMRLSKIEIAYRRLLSENHPDKLIAKGVSEANVQNANEKTRQIREAWEFIQKNR